MYLIHGEENHGRRCSLTPMIFQNSAFSKIIRNKNNEMRGRCRTELVVKSVNRTCPPTTATEGSDSQREWEAWSAPWSPRSVHARWIRLTREINESIVAIDSESGSGSGLGSDWGSDSGSDGEVLKVRMKKRNKGKKRMRIREAIVWEYFSYVVALFVFCVWFLKFVLFCVRVRESGESGARKCESVDLRSSTFTASVSTSPVSNESSFFY